MTRKRFVKLLMSYGYDRDKAVFLATYTNANGVPYATEYKLELPYLRVKKSMNDISKELKQIARNAEQLGRTIHENFEKGFSV